MTTDTPRTDACPHCGAEQQPISNRAGGMPHDGWICGTRRVALASMIKANNKLEAEVERLMSQIDRINNDAFNLANALSKAEAELQRIYAGMQGSCYCCEPVGILNQKLEAEIERIKALPHFHHESYCRKCNVPK